jgi:hypothetical protein
MIGFGDPCHLEVARRLRQDTAVQGGTSSERNIGLDQEDALHMRSFHHRDIARDLSEDVDCAPFDKNTLLPASCFRFPDLNDEDGVGSRNRHRRHRTGEVDICAEGVDAGRQCYCGEDAAPDIFPRGIVVRAPRGVVVRALHVKDHGDAIPRSALVVVRRVGAIVLTISGIDLPISFRRIRSTRVHGQVQANNGARVDGRDGDVSCDGGVGHSGDSGLGDDREVAGISKVDRLCRCRCSLFVVRCSLFVVRCCATTQQQYVPTACAVSVISPSRSLFGLVFFGSYSPARTHSRYIPASIAIDPSSPVLMVVRDLVLSVRCNGWERPSPFNPALTSSL